MNYSFSIFLHLNINTTKGLKILLFRIKIIKPFSKKPKGRLLSGSPLTFASWNQIIQDMRNIYKLKELVSLPVSSINPV
jgi:hypothetical protein